MPSDTRAAELETRLATIEHRLSQLEDAAAPSQTTSAGDLVPATPRTRTTTGSPHPDDDPFWALHTLADQVEGGAGGVLYTGVLDTGAGRLEYQWARPVEHVMARDWAEHAEELAALGHPLRLAILRSLLDGERPVAQLVDELELASTGVAYHHLTALQHSGWVTSPRRGTWALTPSRTISLLTILTALERS